MVDLWKEAETEKYREAVRGIQRRERWEEERFFFFFFTLDGETNERKKIWGLWETF